MAIAQIDLDGFNSAVLDDPGLVSPAERSRARGLNGEDAVRRYLRARAALRVLLARECGGRPDALLLAGKHGVVPVEDGARISYGLSVAGGLAVFAIGRNQPLAIEAAARRGAGGASARCRMETARRALAQGIGSTATDAASLRGFLEGARSLVVCGWTVQVVPTMPGYFVAVAGQGEGWGYRLASPFFPV
ncbi:MAG: hypothetical protein HY821_03720 [Acidobacteria bacterium]|nr:hypothetical protein [Acidobacteriota bacterium]